MTICDGGIFVFTGYEAMQHSGDMQATFLQEGSFWWLSGIDEPGWKMICEGSNGGKTTLFRPDTSETQKIFDGTLDDETALRQSGAQKILPMTDFEHELRHMRRTHPLVKTIKPIEQGNFVHNPALQDMHKLLDRIFENVEDCAKKIYELRAIKQPEEIERIKKAVQHTVRAFKLVRESLVEYRTEYAVEAAFTSEFRRNNLHHAYQPIVASGKHACTLHYASNSAVFTKKQPILIDIGARYHGYSADITRTYCEAPSKRLREVHAAVEHAHHACIALLGPNLLIADYISSVDDIMKRALMDIRLLKDKNDNDTYRKYFPHAISHGLGVDTHDPLGGPRYFQPGMVVTVEPGIYIPEEDIGVRIEDDILITADGYENLSRALSTKL